MTKLGPYLGYLVTVGTLNCPECDEQMMRVTTYEDHDGVSLLFTYGVQLIGTGVKL